MNRIRYFASRLVILSLVAALALGSSVAAQSNSGIGGRPANPDPQNPRTNSIFMYTLEKGATKSDEVIVANNGTKDDTVKLFLVDGMVTNTGAYTCRQNKDPQSGMSKWMTIDATEVALKVGESKNVKFSINVPEGADVGEHNACIAFQSAADSEGEVSGNVRVRTRQALRVAVTIPGDLKRDVSIEGFDVKNENGKQILALGLKNEGNVSADVETGLRLSTLLGENIYSNGGEYPIMANQKLDVTFINENQPFFGGWYKAEADIAYDKRAGVYGTVDKDNLTKKSSGTKIVFIAPTAAGALVMVVMLAAIFAAIAYLVRRRRDLAETRKSWKQIEVKESTNIQELAEKYSTDWRKLARVNNLKAPYLVKKGDTILAPGLATEKPKKNLG